MDPKAPEGLSLKGSVLPNITFRWTGVNYAYTGLEDLAYQNYSFETGEGELDPKLEDALENSGLGISKEALQANKDLANFTNYLELGEGDEVKMSLVLNKENPVLVDRQQIVLKEGQHARVLVDISSEDDVKVLRNGTIYIDAKEDSVLDLVLVSRFGKDATSNISIVSKVSDGAEVNIVNAEVSAGRVLFNYAADLVGIDAQTNVSTAYIASEEASLDLYYNILHKGAETLSDIQANGALLDKAHKAFRGTLDFKEGSEGAKGNEEEYAILLSPDAKSIAVPLLLSHEEEVEGNHAASAGRIDEEMLFYLTSRGINRKQAEGLIVAARITPTLDKIFDDELREIIMKELEERIVL
ncbi:MAG: SufD family Fe-S cluster assembly protein [Coriobacteriia bacterium]|nr:SufD family Fe-S cluster assembly protein [Coriobacteriia bacterium]